VETCLQGITIESAEKLIISRRFKFSIIVFTVDPKMSFDGERIIYMSSSHSESSSISMMMEWIRAQIVSNLYDKKTNGKSALKQENLLLSSRMMSDFVKKEQIEVICKLESIPVVAEIQWALPLARPILNEGAIPDVKMKTTMK